MKKFFALVLAIMMVMSLAIPAAAAGEYTLTINNAVDGHTYEAYQIFSGVLAEKDGKQILSDIEWGNGISNSAEFLTAIKETPGLAVLHSATDADSLAVQLAGVTSDSETLDLFAEVAGTKLGTVAGTSTDAGDTYTISGLDAGYYLVKDMDNTLNGTSEVYTKFIIRVIKSTEVTPKSDVPTVEKTINDTLGGTYSEHEDFDINDIAYYKWEGTLPSNLKSYASYYYKFIDTLPTGIDHLAIQQIYLEGHDGNVVHTFYDITDSDTANDTLPAGITKSEDGSKIIVEFNDLLTLYTSILPTHKVIVKYTARVTRDALIATAMTNNVELVFSNNPNGSGAGNTGKTPNDGANAFTFKITVDKYDADNTAKKLEGAEFVLYYERIVADVNTKYYAKVVTEEMVFEVDADGNLTSTLKSEADRMINGRAVEAKDIGIVYGWDTDRTKASILDTDSNGTLSVRGLDEGIYALEETKAPIGYNLMETPVQIKIAPAYNDDGTLKSVSYEVDSIAQSSDVVGVRNSSGATLPVTGGMGTTLFYVFGSAMVLGALVLLITKKRMAAEN